MGYHDKIECEAFGRSPIEAMRLSIRSSLMAWTGTLDGRPEASWGVSSVSLIDGIGTPWLLCTEEARYHARAFVEFGRATIPLMLGSFRRLENVVSVSNRPAIKLLRLWGFSVGETVQVHGGVEFRPFWLDS